MSGTLAGTITKPIITMAENENIINEAMPAEEKPVEETQVMETPVQEAPAKKAPKAPKQKPVPAEDFDWTSSHKKFDNYSDDERAKLEEKYAGTMNQVADHEVIEGTVVAWLIEDTVEVEYFIRPVINMKATNAYDSSIELDMNEEQD